MLSSRMRRPKVRHARRQDVEVEDEIEGMRERAMDGGGEVKIKRAHSPGDQALLM